MKRQSKIVAEPETLPSDNGAGEAEAVEAIAEIASPEPDPDGWDESLTASRPALPPLEIHQHTGVFEVDRAKILIYGESGGGKTRFSAGFPDVLVCDMDLGMSSVDWAVDAVTIEDFRQLAAVHEFLAAGNHSYTCVVLDTLNEMQRLAMGLTVSQFAKIKRSYGDLPSQSDYGKMLHDMVEMTRKFIALPMQVILTAQVNSRQFETDMLMPQLIGKSTAREVARKMDVIGYISRITQGDQQVPVVDFAADNLVTKDRSFKLPARLVNASYETMAEYWS